MCICFYHCPLQVSATDFEFTTQACVTGENKVNFLNHCGNRRKCLLPAFSPFHTMLFTLPKTNFIILTTVAFAGDLQGLSTLGSLKLDVK